MLKAFTVTYRTYENSEAGAVATARKLEALDDLKNQFSASQFLAVKLNVNDAQEIKDAFAQAKAAFSRIDVVFNNAGSSAMGEAEAIPDTIAREIFETNFWGAANVSKEAVRFFREENTPSGGFIINTSSFSGVSAVPGMGYPSASKHGMSKFNGSICFN